MLQNYCSCLLATPFVTELISGFVFELISGCCCLLATPDVTEFSNTCWITSQSIQVHFSAIRCLLANLVSLFLKASILIC